MANIFVSFYFSDTTEAPTETTTTTEAPDTSVSLPMCAPYKQLVCGMHYVHNLLDADFLDCRSEIV